MPKGADGGQKTRRNKLGSLEIGRFLAALMVMMSHDVPYVNHHAARPADVIFGGILFPGPLGVQYFFALSGFVMASAHHQDFGKFSAIPKFWWRRACRIYPAYWLALCVPAYYLFGAMTPCLTLHLALLDPWYNVEYIPATWSMRYELAFYIMLSLCFLPFVGKPLLVFWIAFTVWTWCGPLVQAFHPAFMMSTYRFTQAYEARFFSFLEFYFFAGLLAGYIYARRWVNRPISIALAAAACLLFLLSLPGEAWGANYGLPMFEMRMSLIIAACILGLALLEWYGILRLGKYATWAGAMSYPLYIFHEPVLLVIDNNLPWGQHHRFGLYAHFIGIAAGTFILVALVTFLLDQPLQRWLRRIRWVRNQNIQKALPNRADNTNSA